MNDAHIYCTQEQFAAEFNAVNEMYLKYFKIFGIEKYVMRFSTHGPAERDKPNLSTSRSSGKRPRTWCGGRWEIGDQFRRGPRTKPPFTAPRSTSRSGAPSGANSPWRPTRSISPCPPGSGLTYHDQDNTDKTPLCIHRAPLGTHERFIGFLIEHYAGNFPLWLAPEQVRVLTIGEDEKLVEYANSIVRELRGHFVRAERRSSSTKSTAKFRRRRRRASTRCWSLAGATWKRATSPCACTAKAALAQSPKGKWWRTYCKRSGSGGHRNKNENRDGRGRPGLIKFPSPVMNEFKFSCPNCQQNIQATPEYSGAQINCPSCQQPIIVPQAPSAPVPHAGKLTMAASTTSHAATRTPVIAAGPLRKKKDYTNLIVGLVLAAGAISAGINFGPGLYAKYIHHAAAPVAAGAPGRADQ